jgi:hypothetical protein
MKNFWNWLISPVATDYTDNPGYIYKRIITWLSVLTITIVLLLLFFLKCNRLTAIITYLSVAGASIAGGAAIGFLFGLPRSEKYRFINKSDTNHNSNNYDYSDNTNLEEVSDWLSKIIVGLTLIKLKTIINWIDLSAHSIESAFKDHCNTGVYLNAYVFGYCIIILYFLAGGGLCYLWARTNLSKILTMSRLNQANLDKQQLVGQVQALTNPGLASNMNIEMQQKLTADVGTIEVPTPEFKSIIESVYNAKSVIDKTDIQKGRWGGKPQVGDKVLEAIYDPNSSFIGLYHIKIQVRSLNVDTPITGQVAFFLHDTFPKEIVYAAAINNKAEIKITAWEAFVVGARLEDKTELELDLNTVKGFPDGFYWKE